MSNITFLIVSRAALDDPDKAAFLRDGMGWGPLYLATHFEEADVQATLDSLTDPMDALCIPVIDALDLGYVFKAIAFRDAVARCVDCMLQYDARGETMVFIRIDGYLKTSVVKADTIDLNNLVQYDMILFDGGNSAGDSWMHTFHPLQLASNFVNENPIKVPNQQVMEVSVDGGQTFMPAPQGVRVVYRDVPVPGDDYPGELHLNLTTEGLISDLWVNGGDGAYLDHLAGTANKMLDDQVSDLIDG